MHLRKCRVHLTNVIGLGAVTILNNLLPTLEKKVEITAFYLPEQNEIKYQISSSKIFIYKRILPKSISRFFECTLYSSKFEGDYPLIVFGDLPLRIKSKQILFLHNKLLLKCNKQTFKIFLQKKIFKWNLKFVDAFIVQTYHMAKLLKKFSKNSKIYCIPQPPSNIFLNYPRKMYKRRNEKLKFIYPASKYPHKNHKIINNLKKEFLDKYIIDKIFLTISDLDGVYSMNNCIKCIGYIDQKELLNYYLEVDALLFLSLEESYGLP